MAILQGAEQLIPVSGSQLQANDLVFGQSLTDLQRATIGYRTFGYSAGYRALMIGDSDTTFGNTTSLWFNVDLSANTNGSFSGNGFEYFFRNGSVFGTPNSGNNGYHYYWGFSDGDITFNKSGTMLVRAPTSDGADDRTLSIAAGGAAANSRGAYITLAGNEAGGLGGVQIHSGSATAGVGINIQVNSSSGELNLGTNSTTRLGINSGGEVYLTNGVLRLNTSNGSDNGEMKLVASGANNATRSGAIQLYGNNHGNASIRGAVEIFASTSVSGAYVKVAGPSSGAFQVEGLDGIRYTNTTFTVRSSASDGADNTAIYVCGGGAAGLARGAQLLLAGNEHGNTGQAYLDSGNASGASANVRSFGANNAVNLNAQDGDVNIIAGSLPNSRWIRFNMNGGERFVFQHTGQIRFAANGTAQSMFALFADTTDGADNKGVWITGGGGLDFFGGTRGASLIVHGNEITGDGGSAYLGTGNTTSSNMTFRLNNPSGSIFWYADATIRWSMQYAGHLIPGQHNVYDIGNNGTFVRNAYIVYGETGKWRVGRGNASSASTSGFELSVDGTTYGYLRLNDADTHVDLYATSILNLISSGGIFNFCNNDTGSIIDSANRPAIQLRTSGTTNGVIFVDGGGFAIGSNNAVAIRAGGSPNGVHLPAGGTSWASHSDSRLKKDIQTLFADNTDALNKVASLRPVSYNFNNDEPSTPKRVGFVAQEVKTIIPEVVDGSDATIYSMRHADLIPFLVAAIQKLKEENDEIKARLDALEN